MNNGTFNAFDYEPNQGTPKHPVGSKFQAYVSHTEILPGKEGKGVVFAVTFTTPQGSIMKRYSVEHENNDAQRIAREQLSALCFATGQFQVSFASHGRELVNKQCAIDVSVQKNDDRYNEVSMVYKPDGEVPRKAQGQALSAPMAAPAPMAPPAAMQPPMVAPQPAQGFAPPAANGFAPQPMAAPQFQTAPQAGSPMPETGKPSWAR
jgi:hypothetical protein